MKVDEVMTRDVLTVAPETAIRDVARVLAENRISGVPVCGANRRLLGVVSEGDILFKEDATSAGARAIVDERAAAKARALTAGQAMSSPAITVPPFRSVAEAAKLMIEHGVNRLPVVKAGELVGIVTRADLVRAFTRSDDEIARAIHEDVVRGALWLEPGAVHIAVDRGRVTLAGEVAGRSDAVVLERVVRQVPGVVAIQVQLSWREDDMAPGAQRAAGRS